MKNFSLLSFATLWSGILVASPFYNTPKVADIKKMSIKTVEAQAAQYFVAQDFDRAYVYYLALSEMKAKLSNEQEYHLGKSALHSQHYDMAKTYLQKASSMRWQTKFPLAVFEYANALKHSGDYQQAIFFYTEYIADHQAERNNDYVGIARRHQQACNDALVSKLGTTVWVDKMGSSFSAAGSTMSLTTPSKYGTRLVEYQDSKGSCLKKVLPNMEMQPLEGMAGDPIFNIGAPYMAPDGETVYFTRREKAANGNPEFKIYSGKITEEGEVGQIQKLDTWVNRDGFSSMYPTLSINEHGQEVLYFAATLPGGAGGYDLWYSVRLTTGAFTRPQNMGVRINSDSDEITPYYDQEGGVLYFSSDKPEGFGGHDVYKMTGAKNLWKENQATHLPMPVNSHANDCYYMTDGAGQGYFSSDRDAKTSGSYKLYQYNPVMTAQSQLEGTKPSEQKK